MPDDPSPPLPDLLYGLLAAREGLVPADLLVQELLARLSNTQHQQQPPPPPLARAWADQHVISATDQRRLERLLRQLLDPEPPPPVESLSHTDPDPDSDLLPPTVAAVDDVQTEQTPVSVSTSPPKSASTPISVVSDTAPTLLEPSRLSQGDGSPDGPATAVDESQAPTSSSLKIPPDGRFRPIRLHAVGGLGLVHVAWDRQLGRLVALKEMRPNVVNDQVLRDRFIREAEINGNLEHPGIVPVYALQNDEQGRPFYAMRFVDGQTLHAALMAFHHQTAQLSASEWTIALRRLIDALLDVCDAIAYAHSRGVLHRDLKPGNIILGKFGETHIIDWGLAKATGQPLQAADKDPDHHDPHSSPPPVVALSDGGDSSHSVAGHAIGSPPYMSPEQARGEVDRLGPATDIYSLGATLYAILAGKPPADGKDTAEILQKVSEGRITPVTEVNDKVPRPLAAICRQAMRLKPEDRYLSASSLAADLRHWMADEPVSVHQDSKTTRVLRWSRHHKSLVGALGGLILATLVGLTALALLVNHQKGRERQINNRLAQALEEAEQARDAAEAHIRLGLDVVDQLVTLGDRQLMAPPLAGEARLDLLEQALEFLRAFRQRAPDDVAVLTDSAITARRVGHLHGLTGRLDQAVLFFEESAALSALLVDRHPEDPLHADRQAEALMDVAEIIAVRGEVAKAITRLHEILAQRGPDTSKTPENSIYMRTLGRGLIRLAATLLMTDQNQQALGAASEAAGLLGTLAANSRNAVADDIRQNRLLSFTDQLEAASAADLQARALAALGDFDEAEATLNQALARLADLSKALSGQALIDLDYFHATLEMSLAQVLLDNPKKPPRTFEAALHLDAAIGLLEPLVEQYPEYHYLQDSLAEALAVRASAALTTSRPDQAQHDARAARKLLENRLASSAPTAPPYLLSLLGLTLQVEASTQNNPETKRQLLQQAIKLQDQALSTNPENPTYNRRKQDTEKGSGLNSSP